MCPWLCWTSVRRPTSVKSCSAAMAAAAMCSKASCSGCPWRGPSAATTTSASCSRTRSPERKRTFSSTCRIRTSRHRRTCFWSPETHPWNCKCRPSTTLPYRTFPPGAWRNVHSWVIDLQRAATRRLGECAFFIDCNPSFSAYTAQAVLAAERLVVPCTADGSSARAIHNVGQLVYGHGVPPEYRDAGFRARAETFSMTLPKLHVVALNRSTTYRQKSAKPLRRCSTTSAAA